MSPSTAIFWPMMAHIVLVYGIYYLLWVRRALAVRKGSARVGQFRENEKEPPESLFVRNSLANQFELPPLFLVLCLSIYVTGHATLYPVLLAWAFVGTRYAHAYVHLGSNRIRYRMQFFASGLLINALLLLWLAVNIALN